MAFALTLTTDNAAFEDGAATETARILRDVAARLERGDLDGYARDANGNRVGSYVLNGRRPHRDRTADASPLDIFTAAHS